MSVRALLCLALFSFSLLADAHIFVYHRFGDSRYPSTDTTIPELERQFKYFKKHGYKVIPLSTLINALQNKEPINKKWVVLTIDDSYESFYKKGLPLFKKYNYPFTLFVLVEATQKKYGDFMTWQQVKEASKYGEIGLHSYRHPHLTKLSSNKIEKDTKLAYDLFTKKLGYKPQYYAYPYGEYDKRVRTVIEGFNFKAVLNQNNGAISHYSDLHNLDRIALVGKAVSLQKKLAITQLPITWHSPLTWPDNAHLKTIEAYVPKEYTSLNYFVSGYGWQKAKVKDGHVNISFNKKLTNPRTRIFFKSGSAYGSTILVK